MKKLLASVFVAAVMIATPALATDLTIGVRTEIQMDPHFAWTDANVAYYDHIYGGLTKKDRQLKVHPGLAESWSNDSPTKWRFVLRDGVTFQDGSPLTADDVVASFDRVKTIKAGSPFTGAIPGVVSVEAEDEHTVIITTSSPQPLLASNVSAIEIIPAEIAESATTEDFNSGKAAIGTGPYKVVEYQAGDHLLLERNDDYWGEKAKWDHVTFRFLPNDPARLAALLGGDVDLIDYVQPQLVDRIKNDPGFKIVTTPSLRVMALTVDSGRDQSPQVTDKAGNPIENPMKDVRVRRAMSMAIDRKAISDRVMNGLAAPAGQLAPDFLAGYNDSVEVPEVDLAAAKALLAEAGYPDGFALTINCTNDRYLNDAQVCQALGQMLSRLGLKIDVQTMPASIFFPKVNLSQPGGPQFSALLTGWSDTRGEALVLQSTLHTHDDARGLGAYNRGNYSNPELDKVLDATLSELDAEKRHALLAEAMKIAMDDVAAIPLYYQSVIVAERDGISYEPWPTEATMADSASLTAAQ
ncbi:ABC transporter substrate-binding protein [Acuticoccus mangrovi]|uniref:ABC transporter substrate-binding protein n=1 Tax=Acuticoccus mangrovi TaxID=2796142 RepID=A0A934IV17_9HYPH|nr:ABC transporter substrate-binding protein [Acuticoccus mangrovi]MBJ3778545.1 ABC transporter substrate-binding protein [Acuticoccus mangrovi]